MEQPQQALDVRRARRMAMAGTRERLVSDRAATAALIDRRIADAGDLQVRQRRLELARLTSDR